MKYILRVFITFTCLLLTYPSVASENTPSTRSIPSVPAGIMNKFYTTIGQYDDSTTVGFFFPQIIQGHTWTCWWNTEIFSGNGIGFRKSFWKNYFWGIYFYRDLQKGILETIEALWQNPFTYKSSSRVNVGLELSHTHVYQLTTNFHHSFIDKISFQTGRSLFQDKSGLSARITCYLFEKMVPFFSIAYTKGLEKEYRWSSGMTESTLITAAIGARHRMSGYTSFEWKINIPEFIKYCSEDAIISRTYYQNFIHIGIQFKFNDANEKINQLPERYIPYHANAASESLFRI